MIQLVKREFLSQEPIDTHMGEQVFTHYKEWGCSVKSLHIPRNWAFAYEGSGILLKGEGVFTVDPKTGEESRITEGR